MTDINQFMRNVSTDDSLQEELLQAVGGKEGKEALEAIVELAQLKGFNVSVNETMTAFSKAIEANSDRELSDQDLEGVAGGFGSIKDFLKKIDNALYSIGL